MTTDSLFLEVDFAQRIKSGERICGDSFFSRKIQEENRVLAVLSDGLGSGVKANILSSMTATMALRFVASNMEFLHSAEVMMDALPVCSVRRISYATFTIVDSVLHGWTRIIEMDNPGFLLLRDGAVVPVEKRHMSSPKWSNRTIHLSEIFTLPEDRIVFFSDGVTQAGMGAWPTPLGWREEGCADLVLRRTAKDPHMSARRLARAVVDGAFNREPDGKAGDDITCAVMYFRTPRRLLLLSGPPFARERDGEYAHLLDDFRGKKVLCGGTTADIVARELHRPIETDLRAPRGGLPPISIMEGVDLVTEGILTLTRTCRHLEEGLPPSGDSGAIRLVNLLLESDVIDFVVGTRVNEAHQDPSLPTELEMRRSIVRNLARLLETKYLKRTSMRFI